MSASELAASLQPLSLAIGAFDGVHKGHQQVINKAKGYAEEKGIASAVMTFDPMPKSIFGQGVQYQQAITPLPDKLKVFKELEVDFVFVVQFDTTFTQITPEQFVDEILLPLQVKNVVVGFDFRFGAGGKGDTKTLLMLSEGRMQVHIVDGYHINGEKVSSTLIRECIDAGDMTKASLLLGRPYEITATVATGDQRGRTIGFPTANLKLTEDYILPRLGVYAIIAYYQNKSYFGVLNFGMKPTFNKNEIVPVMEAHLFDFNEDIYGEQLKVQFIQFLRPEKKFNGVGELIAQIKIDAAEAKQLLLNKHNQLSTN